MVLAKSPVVNAGDDRRLRSRAGSSPHNPQQSIVAHRQHQSLGEARCRPAAECQPQMVDDAFQPCRPARPGRENIVPEPFGENPPPTMRYLANEPSRDHAEAYLLLPAHGKSATSLSYRLWIRRDLAPHNGHSAMPPSDRTAKIIESDESLTLSITNPLGTSDEIRIPARMARTDPLVQVR
jgi:hypothetical protein